MLSGLPVPTSPTEPAPPPVVSAGRVGQANPEAVVAASHFTPHHPDHASPTEQHRKCYPCPRSKRRPCPGLHLAQRRRSTRAVAWPRQRSDTPGFATQPDPPPPSTRARKPDSVRTSRRATGSLAERGASWNGREEGRWRLRKSGRGDGWVAGGATPQTCGAMRPRCKRHRGRYAGRSCARGARSNGSVRSRGSRSERTASRSEAPGRRRAADNGGGAGPGSGVGGAGRRRSGGRFADSRGEGASGTAGRQHRM